MLVLGGSSGLVLEPKLAASALPTLVVIELGNDAVTIIDTKAHAFRLGAVISNGTATNLFQDLAGEVSGTAKYKGVFPPTSFSGLSLGGFARGTDTSGGGNGSALLKFKISTHGLFVQQ